MQKNCANCKNSYIKDGCYLICEIDGIQNDVVENCENFEVDPDLQKEVAEDLCSTCAVRTCAVQHLCGANLCGANLRGINGEKVSIKDFMIVTGLGSQNRQTFIFYTNIGIVLQCGCFFGTEKEFKKKVKETHKGTNYEKEYMGMLKLAKIRFSRESEG